MVSSMNLDMEIVVKIHSVGFKYILHRVFLDKGDLRF